MSYTRISSAAAVLLGFILTPVSAATLYFDFGDSAQTTANNYNNIIVNPPGVLSIANSIDSTGSANGHRCYGCWFLYWFEPKWHDSSHWGRGHLRSAGHARQCLWARRSFWWQSAHSGGDGVFHRA